MRKILNTFLALLTPVAFAESQPSSVPAPTNIASNPSSQLANNTDQKMPAPSEPDINQYTEEQWLTQHTDVLEKNFTDVLQEGSSTKTVKKWRDVYVKWNKHNPLFVEWADALILSKTDLPQSTEAFRKLLAKTPNHYVHYQLIENLFDDHNYQLTKVELDKLHASQNLSPALLQKVNDFQKNLAQKEDWSFSFNLKFSNDKNFNESAKVGTKFILPNGMVITQPHPIKKATGLSSNLGASKQWVLNNGKYFAVDADLYGLYYWNHQSANELNARVSGKFGYKNSKFMVEGGPSFSKRWYAGISPNPAKPRLKRYNNTYGINLSTSYKFMPEWRYSFAYSYDYEKYDNALDSMLNGSYQSIRNSILFSPNSKQKWTLHLNASKLSNSLPDDSYRRYETRLNWEQEWPKDFATDASVSLVNRQYEGINPQFGVKQKNTEFASELSVWNDKIQYRGFSPRVNWRYEKQKSNITFKSYHKHLISFEVSKSF